jgi:tRNA-splicing ligase RtcB (3'-phosphate/5'-hydroxy nucleic acid ligase)
MSFKYEAKQVGDCHYVLPPVGKMKVEAHAWLSPELYEASEEALWGQLANGASYEGVVAAHLMPDCHSGYGVPVGAVIVTDNTIIQAASGYDISCGVLAMRVPGLTAGKVKGKYNRERWITEVEKRVATGVGSHRPQLMPAFTQSKIDEVLHFGAKALGMDSDLCERQYIPIPEGTDLRRIERAYSKALPQLGSLGGGNHFIELQLDEDGFAWVMVHCGSRGYGWQTAEHYFYAGAQARGLSPKRREESFIRLDEALGQEYWAYHNSAANYAVANRYVISQGIREALQEVFQVDGEVYYDISHNLAQLETLVLPDGGGTKKGYVHRKGATRAFPGGHPDLHGTKWAVTGHPVLIPGSMYEGAAILMPELGAHLTACSVNHGSGRLMARGEAKRKLRGRDGEGQRRINAEMSGIQRTFGGVTVEGIISNHKNIPLDECGKVYKDLGSVLDVLDRAKVARVIRRMFPVANVKGAD